MKTAYWSRFVLKGSWQNSQTFVCHLVFENGSGRTTVGDRAVEADPVLAGIEASPEAVVGRVASPLPTMRVLSKKYR